MDTVTISAIVFIVIMSATNILVPKTTNGVTLILALVASIGNFFQFGHFSGLWPFTLMGWFYVVLFFTVGVVFAIKAYVDAKDAE